MDVVEQPFRVTVSPHHSGSTVFGPLFAPDKPSDRVIDRVFVTGGERWVPSWNTNSVNYDNPERVEVHLRGEATPRVFAAPLDIVSIYTTTDQKIPVRAAVKPVKRRRWWHVLGEDYLLGTDVLVGYHADESQQVVGHRGGYAGPPVMVPGMIYPLAAASDMLDEAIGEVETVLGQEETVLGHGGHHGWGRGWGRGWGYPYGAPLDLGYTVDTGRSALADAALAEAIQQNTALQKELKDLEERKKKGKSVLGGGGGGGGHHGGGAQGFYRGGWFGGDYPAPFAYVGPYEDVDTALAQSGADEALAEAVQQNTQLQRDLERTKLEQAARTVGGDFEDFDRRMVRFTGKMRGGG